MLLLRTLVVSTCVILTLALKTPPRTLNIRGASLTPVEIAYVENKARKIGQTDAQALYKAEYDERIRSELNGTSELLRIEATTYAPRPTTSMPQSKLRALCTTPRGKFSHPLDCRKYVDCWDGRVLEKRCPNDLVFSDLPGEFCDYLEYVDCGTRPVLIDSNEIIASGGNQVAPAGLPFIQPPVATPTQPPPPPPPTAPPAPLFKWTSASNGVFPANAVSAGGIITGPSANDRTIFIGRALLDGHIIPCTVRFGQQGCSVAWGNREVLYKEYDVLEARNPRWVAMDSNSPIPPNAFSTGLLDQPTGVIRMYSGRAAIGNTLLPGYLTASDKRLIQTKDGQTYFTDRFEILLLL